MADPLDYKPQQAHIVHGDRYKKTPPDKIASSIEEITVPNWIKRFEFFQSPTGSVDPKIVYQEYTEQIQDFLIKNQGATITDVRKAVGVIVTPDGKEVLTKLGEHTRNIRETQQRPTVTEQGKRVQTKNLPEKWQFSRKGSYLDSLSAVLEEHGVKLDTRLQDMKWEGHHIKGLGNLDPFYKGATEAERFELNQTLINNGYTAGRTKGNFAWLSPEQHKAAHKKLGWGVDEAMVDIDRPSTIPDYDTKAIPSGGQRGVSAISPEWQQKISDAPFNRPEWQDELLKKGVPPKNIDGIEITRANYLKEWLGLTDEAYMETINSAIRENPIKGIDPELQIQANIRHQNPQLFEDYRAIAKRGADGWTMNGLAKSTTGISRAESLVRIMGGDYVGGAMGLAMTSPVGQRAIGSALEGLTKQAGKQLFKWIPGVSLGTGALQAMGYLKGGAWQKAGLSMMGGIIGEFGPLGDAAQATIDLGLAGHDALEGRGVIKSKKSKAKTPKVDIPNEDDLIRRLGRLGRQVELNPKAFL